jgi:hydrophobic/amphiphilic exporter-1 (mainly G- bacteria), HAE1 family
LMGAVPIAVGWGAGASTRRPLGLAVVGGLAFSQLVTLYVTPVFYTYLDDLQQRFSRHGMKAGHAPVVAPDSPLPGAHRPEPAAT